MLLLRLQNVVLIHESGLQEIWNLTRSVNLDGAFFVVQAVARQMKEQVTPFSSDRSNEELIRPRRFRKEAQSWRFRRLAHWSEEASKRASFWPFFLSCSTDPSTCSHYTPTKAGVKVCVLPGPPATRTDVRFPKSLMESCAISLSPYGIRCSSSSAEKILQAER